VRLPAPPKVNADGVIPSTDSEPTFRTTTLALTDWPTVLVPGATSIETRSGALLRRSAFGAAIGASSGPSFPEALVIPLTGIASRMVVESAGEPDTVTETKYRPPPTPSGEESAPLCQ